MAKSAVSIVKGNDAEQMVDKAFSLLGGLDSLIRPNATIVVKPSAGHPVIKSITAGQIRKELV